MWQNKKYKDCLAHYELNRNSKREFHIVTIFISNGKTKVKTYKFSSWQAAKQAGWAKV